MWEFNYTDELYHGKHKYIAKIGEGAKARYFYTQEALAAYKKALSSKDEKAALDKALEGPGVTKRDITDARTGRVIGTATTIEGKENIDRVWAAEGKYAEASTLKGKAKAVKDVFNERNPNAANTVKKTVMKPVENAKDYAKALSSKDEQEAYDKAKKSYNDSVDTYNKALNDYNDAAREANKAQTISGKASGVKNTLKAVKNRDVDGVKNSLSAKDEIQKAENADRALNKAEKDTITAQSKMRTAEADLSRSKTAEGKATAVAEVFSRHNAERIERGRKFFNSLFR